MKKTASIILGLLFSLLLHFSYATACSISNAPWILNVEQTRAVINWTTDVGTDAEVKYGTSSSLGSRVYYDSGGILGLFSNTIHMVRLQNLMPSTWYYYQVKSCDFLTWFCDSSSIKSFVTAPKDTPYKFIVYGETWTGSDKGFGGGTNADHQNVISTIRGHGPDFIVHLGNQTTDGISSSLWSNYFDIEKNLIGNSCIFPLRGVREAYSGFTLISGDGSNNNFKKFFFPILKFGAENYFYFWSYSTSWMFALDTSRAEKTNVDYAVGSYQYNNVEQHLIYINSKASHGPVIVFSHYPVFSSVKEIKSIQQNLIPLFQTYGVDVVVSGHVSGYERLAAVKGVHYVNTGGGGAPLEPVKTSSRTVASATGFNFVSFYVSGNTVEMFAYKVNSNGSSTLIDSLVIEDVTLNDYQDPAFPKPLTMEEEAELAGGCSFIEQKKIRAGAGLIMLIPAVLLLLWRRYV